MTHKETVSLEQAYQKVLESHNMETSGFEGDLEKDQELIAIKHDEVDDQIHLLKRFESELGYGEDLTQSEYWQESEKEAYELAKISPETLNRIIRNGKKAQQIIASGQSYDEDKIQSYISTAVDARTVRDKILHLADLIVVQYHDHFDGGDAPDDF